MLLHDIGKPRMHTVDENGISHFKKHQFQGAYMAEKILKRLRIDNASAKYIYELIWEHDNRIPAHLQIIHNKVKVMLSHKSPHRFFRGRYPVVMLPYKL